MKKNYLLTIIFAVALIIRFYHFHGSTYFGFDEARDAFISQAIYHEGAFKLIGPPANAPGLNHGVLHWYIIGILYLIGHGSPFFVSAVFRIINSLAIFPIFWIANKLFGKRTAYISALIYAFSFEATQYAIYYGNPSLAVLSWISLFAGAVIILKNKHKFWGLPLMALGIASGAQLELFLVILSLVGAVILIILWKQVKLIKLKSWILALVIGLSIISPYIAGEIKYNFRSFKSALNLVQGGYQIAGHDETKTSVYIKRWLLILHDNFLPLNNQFLWIIAFALLFFWLSYARKKIEYKLLLVWIFAGVFIFMFGAYNSYYINVGIGTGLIIGLATAFDKLIAKTKFLGNAVVVIVLLGNLHQILKINQYGLIEDIKTQQYMLLADEIKVIDQMYRWANKESFTVRITSMPYRMQTVWAYLFDHYGKPSHGYLPYYELGNVLGYPGYLPEPQHGTTCVRFLLREPIGGIPLRLINKDISDENIFSHPVKTIQIGHFYLEKRLTNDPQCFSSNFPI